MTEPRRLALRRETLTSLATADLENVVGARAITTNCTTIVSDTNSFRCQWTFNTCEACYA